jgi:hypothetical protein
VIVAIADPQLLIVGTDALANPRRLPEIERTAVHGAQFAGRDLRVIGDGEPLRGDLQHVPEHIAGPVEIEIAVLGETDDGAPVGGRRAIQPQTVVLR